MQAKRLTPMPSFLRVICIIIQLRYVASLPRSFYLFNVNSSLLFGSRRNFVIYIDVITFNLMYDLLVFMCADVNGAISCYLLYNIFKATPLSLFYMLETGL